MLSKECTRQVIEEIMKLFPDATPALNFSNNYELLIAVMLSAQTTDIAVNKVTEKLFEDYPDPYTLAQAEPEDIENYIKTIGLYKNKSKYAVGIARDLVNKFDGVVPSTRKELTSLPGVGQKTSNVIQSVGFGIPAFAVDTHVSRVAKHHNLVEENYTVKQIEERLTDCLPEEYWHHAHLAMILFGRQICHPRNPKCENYPQLYLCNE